MPNPRGARIEAAVADRAAALTESNAQRVEDEPTRRWLQTSALVLAAFRELRPVVGAADALAILSEAMTEPFRKGLTDYIGSFTNIQRCFFNDFFRANGAPEVPRVVCALDNVWADAIQDPEYGVRFERPTTLAQGDDACRFQFSRTSPTEG